MTETCGAREPEPRTGTSPCVLAPRHGGTKHQDKWTNQWPVDRERQPDPDCERCDGSGLDPDAFFREGEVWTHAPCSECLPEGDGETEPQDDAPCASTFREEPMPDAVYCGERGHHGRHTAWQGSDYYAWLDGDEGAGRDLFQ